MAESGAPAPSAGVVGAAGASAIDVFVLRDCVVGEYERYDSPLGPPRRAT